MHNHKSVMTDAHVFTIHALKQKIMLHYQKYAVLSTYHIYIHKLLLILFAKDFLGQNTVDLCIQVACA